MSSICCIIEDARALVFVGQVISRLCSYYQDTDLSVLNHQRLFFRKNLHGPLIQSIDKNTNKYIRFIFYYILLIVISNMGGKEQQFIYFQF